MMEGTDHEDVSSFETTQANGKFSFTFLNCRQSKNCVFFALASTFLPLDNNFSKRLQFLFSHQSPKYVLYILSITIGYAIICTLLKEIVDSALSKKLSFRNFWTFMCIV